MKITSFKQELTVSLPARQIYDMYMDSKKHSVWTGDKAIISSKIGGKFSVFGGYAGGKNVELIDGKKIVQTWRAEEEQWPAGHYSTVEFTFKSMGKNKTRITLKHTNIPASIANNFKSGWKDFYWTPLKQMAAGK